MLFQTWRQVTCYWHKRNFNCKVYKIEWYKSFRSSHWCWISISSFIITFFASLAHRFYQFWMKTKKYFCLVDWWRRSIIHALNRVKCIKKSFWCVCRIRKREVQIQIFFTIRHDNGWARTIIATPFIFIYKNPWHQNVVEQNYICLWFSGPASTLYTSTHEWCFPIYSKINILLSFRFKFKGNKNCFILH